MKPSLTALLTFILFLGFACNSKKKTDSDLYKLNEPLTKQAPYDEGYPLTDDKIDETAPYKAEDFIKYYSDYYADRKTPPPFDYKMDLSGKSFSELRLLRSEILARHNFLFMDYVLRSHFNATKWYKPVFWYNDLKIRLSDEEKKFIEKVLVLENNLYKKNYIVNNEQKTANLENVVNWQQFEKIPDVMLQHLRSDGFVINKGNYEQLFHVYDENYYDYTPSFITTDLFLQVLHMHVSKEMQTLEKEKMIPVVISLIEEQYNVLKQATIDAKTPETKKAAGWGQVYYAIGLSLIKGDTQVVPAEFEEFYSYENQHASEGQGSKSEFLDDPLMDYSQFQPRGNYTRSDSLKRYFKCIKWLNSASIYLDDDTRLASAIIMANGLLQSKSSLNNYSVFSNIISFLAGDENNLSMAHLMEIMDRYKGISIDDLISQENLKSIRSALYSADPKRMVPKGANARTEEQIARKKVLFTAGRYTFDSEIIQRLVDIAREDLRTDPKRPFPKGLDVYAAMGNKTAEDILLNVYKEDQSWENYSDTLEVLKNKFKTFNNWDLSIYNKTMETVLSLQNYSKDAPYFIQSPGWKKKDLNTMLASWTELKHDMILYIEQPNAAEMGDGGEVPPPQKIAYVEPRTDFWQKCIELLELNKKMLDKNNLSSNALEYRNKRLTDIASLLLNISRKELSGDMISNNEFDELSFIGGKIESLTLNIIESDKGLMSEVSTPDRYIAIAADVFNYNDNCLEEAVGMGDEIYVVVEINGLLYLTRGAVFSHYEFKQPTSSRLTDEEWQKLVLNSQEPKSAIWMDDIKINAKKLKTAPNFNLY